LVVHRLVIVNDSKFETEESQTIMLTLILFIAGIALIFWGGKKIGSSKMDVARYKKLISRYNDEQVAYQIMNHMFWQGQTAAQLEDSIGRPVAVDKGVKKNMTKDVWKYHQTGKNRYHLRLTLENGVVVGWDKKSDV